MTRIRTILARRGSKGLPRKDLGPLMGKPLIAHTIDQARVAGLFVPAATSSDLPEILTVPEASGADHVIRRPDEINTERASKLPAMQHWLAAVKAGAGTSFDLAVDLDPTSGLRTPEDLARLDQIRSGEIRTYAERTLNDYLIQETARNRNLV